MGKLSRQNGCSFFFKERLYQVLPFEKFEMHFEIASCTVNLEACVAAISVATPKYARIPTFSPSPPSHRPSPSPPCTDRVVDALAHDEALRVADATADHHLVQVEHQPHQHLDHHGHEQVPVDLGAVVLQRPDDVPRSGR